MLKADRTIVRPIDLFHDMAEENYEQLMRACYPLRLAAGTQFITEGDPADCLFVLLEGSVECFVSTNCKETILQVLLPVSAFVLAAIPENSVYRMSARAIEQSRTLIMPMEIVREVFERDEAFARSVIKEVAASYWMMVRSLRNQRLISATNRVARYLVRRQREQAKAGRVNLQFDKFRLASLLGMQPETLSRALATLRLYGVEANGTRITLSDPSRLETLVKSEAPIDDLTL